MSFLFPQASGFIQLGMVDMQDSCWAVSTSQGESPWGSRGFLRNEYSQGHLPLGTQHLLYSYRLRFLCVSPLGITLSRRGSGPMTYVFPRVSRTFLFLIFWKYFQDTFTSCSLTTGKLTALWFGSREEKVRCRCCQSLRLFQRRLTCGMCRATFALALPWHWEQVC